MNFWKYIKIFKWKNNFRSIKRALSSSCARTSCVLTILTHKFTSSPTDIHFNIPAVWGGGGGGLNFAIILIVFNFFVFTLSWRWAVAQISNVPAWNVGAIDLVKGLHHSWVLLPGVIQRIVRVQGESYYLFDIYIMNFCEMYIFLLTLFPLKYRMVPKH